VNRRAAATDIVLAVALLLGLSALAGPLISSLPEGLLPPLLLIAIVQGMIVLVVVAVLLHRHAQTLRTIGLLRPTAVDLQRGLFAVLLAIGVSFLFNLVVLAFAPDAFDTHSERLTQVAGALAAEASLPALLLAVMLIGFYEEVLARGLLLHRCRAVFHGHWPPVLVSSLLFGLGHAYQGWTGIVQTMLIGMLFAHLTMRWGTLWPVIIAHAALNGFSIAALNAMS
jgi:uncharacterized protein